MLLYRNTATFSHRKKSAVLSKLKGSGFPTRQAGRFELPAIQDPLFELEVAAVEIVKIIAD